MDGVLVEVGDQVHHLTLGNGVVETIEKGTARIRMNKGGGIKNMSEGGYTNGSRLFFWGEPTIIAPVKGEIAKHKKAVNLFLALKEMINE
ncbi:hypothetical protein HPC38_02325 [Pasteurellaceae bacterium HPA106]|uniref:hypothetical protein n=1 Tax=Spirabiliibacterium pneumoniae TaxID=221400 RepID=UPI001AAC9850|nr:hypothetical protein [Spirabiliibacterium pneumoniae]MBE2895715.1 hypothetical protein [Spirabiliibacterium pneumoniae]